MNINIIVHKDAEKNEINISEFKDKIIQLFKEKKVDEYFFNHSYVLNKDIKINFMSKKELDNYIISVDNSFNNIVPKWVTGITTDTGIYMVTPTQNTINEDIILALHKSIHYLSKQLKECPNNVRYLFLEEAISTYICSQMTTGKFSKIVEDYNTNNLRTISSLLNSNGNKEFADNNGYYYAFFFMKFLKNKYKKEKIIDYITNSKELLDNLKTLESEFRKFLIEQILYYTKL